ncbi:MAG: hydantoinase/oxoprolinase family protein [Microbacterium sp.]|uniref:hydantoinase/oxoprolinase family protein n=1 Tax=Microbacterium sp. TaxID=51671 RepID=UPI0039E68FFC
MSTLERWRVAVDIGGTFTDCVVVDEAGRRTISKALTTPESLDEGVLAALEANAETRSMGLDDLLGRVGLFVHGTTQATNALLVRRGARTGLLTTSGHEDSLVIGKIQSKVAGLNEREFIHASRLRKPEPIIPRALTRGIVERIDRDGEIVVALDEEAASAAIAELVAEGVESIAIALLWSFVNPVHEEWLAGHIRATHPQVHVALSHETSPTLGEYERTATTAVSAYVGPRVASYLERLEQRLREHGYEEELLIMQASGGLTSVADAIRKPIVTLDSGPTGGILGSRALGESLGEPNLICTDVGGTSFDVGLVLNGELPLDPEPVVGQFALRLPKVLVQSIGSGGGSIAWIDSGGLLRVGPQSATSNPGPACYGRGGDQPTVTDADLVLGYIDPDSFVGGRMKLRRDLAYAALERLGSGLGMTAEEVAIGISRIVNSQMADLVRKSTIEMGHDPRNCTLVAYGGSGPSHAAFYGGDIGVRSILVPPDSTVFSAEGMLSCDYTHTIEASHRVGLPLGPEGRAALAAHITQLSEAAASRLTGGDAESGQAERTVQVGARFRSQIHTLPVTVELDPTTEGFEAYLEERFLLRYREQFGRGAVIPGGGVEIAYIRLTASRAIDPLPPRQAQVGGEDLDPIGARSVHFDQYGGATTPIYAGAALRPGHHIEGPAVIERMGDSVIIPPRGSADVDDRLIIHLAVQSTAAAHVEHEIAEVH